MELKMEKESLCQLSLKDKNFYSFKSECSCFSHDISVFFEKEENSEMVSLSFYDKVYLGENTDRPFWSRIKAAFQILFKGYFEVEHGFIFKGKEHVDDFMQYMTNGYNTIYNKETSDFKNRKRDEKGRFIKKV